MKRICAIMAIMIMVLGASITCIAAPSDVDAKANELVTEAANRSAEMQNQAREEVENTSLPIGVKIGGSIAVGCIVSLIIVMGMIRGMNTAREATQADNYYDVDDVRVAISSDRYTHTTRKVIKKQQKS